MEGALNSVRHKLSTQQTFADIITIITSVIKISTNMNASVLVCMVALAQSPPVEGRPLLCCFLFTFSLPTHHPPTALRPRTSYLLLGRKGGKPSFISRSLFTCIPSGLELLRPKTPDSELQKSFFSSFLF